jgi:hypothetical protein
MQDHRIAPRQRGNLRLIAAPAPDHDAQRDAFWTAIATAATAAIADVDPNHPDVAQLRRFTACARRGAGLPLLVEAPASVHPPCTLAGAETGR